MRLFAAGFNTWNQLVFDPSLIKSEPEDLTEAEVILENANVQVIAIWPAHTLLRTDQGLQQAGASTIQPSDVTEFTKIIVNGAGEGLKFENKTHGSSIRIFTTFGTALDDIQRGQWDFDKTISQVAPYDVGWVILFDDGSVGTVGDPRFADCLGREVTAENPAERPAKVQDLDGLGEPVRKVAAGGYTVMALTQSGGLYAWGAQAPGSHRQQLPIAALNGVPNYVEVDGDVDIQDIAVGECHAITLSTEGEVFVLGGNRNGQLGLGQAATDHVSSWTKLDIPLRENERVVGVFAGARSSFLLTEEGTIDP
ncbi:regulator of chromosome condensation 1/beta-lactamase-inhibitor protein II [Emericellopsis atlantica]|uniref:Regulator of chromosome condensation 1/beta-lactamase-inhibitor protein II n=1 Tax=Emericellopsis atlantica TaxID=2614577 RepID=A0A9P7ZS38_9HYPO|nr:regulator of chromosome condensation 1/beta-lactamase-inhibitor protein II [Emericellopsis atlantica]KAG9256638.1 regulator of chromosome condensation 1/beta-lactamase-inhibitor protein II [Emericellopsis atlantica]